MAASDWPIVLTRGLMAHVNLYPGRRLLYLMNPKAACSSVKQSLWLHHDRTNGVETYPGNPHQARHLAPFRYAAGPATIHPRFTEHLRKAVTFTLVRNPYVRVLSAYLDKVQRSDRERPVWLSFSQAFGLGIDARPSFIETLNLLRVENPYLMERHFAPQWVNVLADLIGFDRVFHVEHLAELSGFLAGFGIETSRFNVHATKAAALLSDYYGDAEIAAVREIYARDFDLFGYDRDIRRPAPHGPFLAGHAEVSTLEDAVVLFASVPEGEKEKRLERFAAKAPTADLAHLRLTAIGMSLEEKLRAAADIERSGNWRYASEIGADLARAGAVRPALRALEAARAIQENRGAPGRPAEGSEPPR